MKTAGAALVLLVLPVLLSAQIVLKNPGFPATETMVYVDAGPNDSHRVDVTMSLHSDKAKTWYEYTLHSFTDDILVKIDPDNLFAFSIDGTTQGKDSVVRRQTQFLKTRRIPVKNEILVSDLGTLQVVLRGFPWGQAENARLIYLGNSASLPDLSFEFKVLDHQTITVAGKTWDTWKTEMGLEGLIGALVPKTTMWFQYQAPHILVRSQGPFGDFGAPTRTYELQSYSATR